MALTVTGRPNPTLLANVLDVQLTNAQMLALRATPVTLVPAQGVDRATIVERVYIVSDSGTGTAWTETDDNMDVRYAGSTVILTIETTGLIDTGDVQSRYQAPAEAVATPIPNSAVELVNNGDGEFGGGDPILNSFSVRVWFRVVDTVPFS